MIRRRISSKQNPGTQVRTEPTEFTEVFIDHRSSQCPPCETRFSQSIVQAITAPPCTHHCNPLFLLYILLRVLCAPVERVLKRILRAPAFVFLGVLGGLGGSYFFVFLRDPLRPLR